MAEAHKEKRGLDPEVIGAVALSCCIANSVPAIMENKDAKTAVCFVAGACVGYSIGRYVQKKTSTKRKGKEAS